MITALGHHGHVNLAAYESKPLTYPEVGATRGRMPAGYHHVHEARSVGHGAATFERAAATVLGWDVHRGAGLRVTASTPVAQPGAVAVLGLGPLRVPCRVVYVVDEPLRRGFAYGTLPGHPECGEESFVVELDPDSGDVLTRITAFSRPGNRLIRLAGPANRMVQSVITRRYLRAVGSV